MQDKTASDKPNYQALLRERAKEVYKRASVFNADEAELAIDVIAEALKEVALESWKNGIEAGRRKASKSAGSTKQA